MVSRTLLNFRSSDALYLPGKLAPGNLAPATKTMDSKLSRWCDGFIEVGWLAAVIVTPLFFNIHSDRVFEPDKLALLRTIAVLMAAAWLVKFVDQKGWQQRKRLDWRQADSLWRMPFLAVVTLLAVVYLISTLFSVTRGVSWAGSYQRMQGTYTTLSYIVIFLTAIATMRSMAQVRRVVTAVIITSIPVAFYGLLQHFDLDPLPWAGDVTERVAGHMGNAIFIAAYLIMAVPLTLARILSSFSNIMYDEEVSGADVLRSSAYIFILAIQLIAIYWSGSRGPWLGLGVGLFAFILIVLVNLRNVSPEKGRFRGAEAGRAVLFVLVGTAVAFIVIRILLQLLGGRFPALSGAMGSFLAFVGAVGIVVVALFVMASARRGWRWLWFSWITLSLFLGVWLVAFNLPPDLTRPYLDVPVVGDAIATLDEWRELPRIGRFGQILQADSATGRVRVLIWTGVLDLLTPHEPLQYPDGSLDSFNFLRPLIGYGPEAMYVAYNRFYPPELATIEARNASPDRSHNETFDALVITGIVGFLIWQALYLSVFYVAFRWLGVLRGRRDRNLLIGLWVGMGILVALLFTIWRGAVYVGVAYPFGTILGVVIYLIYYALSAESVETESQPFAADRLLVTALVAAILAHYVEIHFGIAIAATRTHFFLYTALLFLVTYLFPRLKTETAVRKRSRRQTTPKANPGWGPVLLNMLILGLIIGIMGYTFTTYNQPPGQTGEELLQLSAGDIFRQSFFQDASKDFVDSPFIYLMVILTWGLGILIMASEMVKDKELNIPQTLKGLAQNRQKITAVIFLLMGVGSIGYRLIAAQPTNAGATALLGQSLLWLWGAVSIWAAARLFVGKGDSDRTFAGGVALAGLLLSLPVLVAGGVGTALITAVASAVILYLLWDKSWSDFLLPIGILGGGSLLIGMSYTYFQAYQLRNSLLYRFTQPQPETLLDLQKFVTREADQAVVFLIYLFGFVILLLAVTAVILALTKTPKTKAGGSVPAALLLLGLLVLAGWFVFATNVQVIQADMVYKRGRFFDNEATRTGALENWDSAIAIYQDALNRVPREDFYYLFLGRAYLERSTLTQDPAEKAQLLQDAEDRLLLAQKINPLNTDHTANLARLNTRWVALTEDEADRQKRIAQAEDYYQKALSLSPQNSVIRNEYARLVFNLKQDCDGAIQIFEESNQIDPYFTDTYFDLAQTYQACAVNQPPDVQEEMRQKAIETIKGATEQRPNDPQIWVRAGQLLHDLGAYEDAVQAYEMVHQLDPSGEKVAGWNLDFLLARTYAALGQIDQAVVLTQQALATAPPQYTEQIQQFLTQLTGGG